MKRLLFLTSVVAGISALTTMLPTSSANGLLLDFSICILTIAATPYAPTICADNVANGRSNSGNCQI